MSSDKEKNQLKKKDETNIEENIEWYANKVTHTHTHTQNHKMIVSISRLKENEQKIDRDIRNDFPPCFFFLSQFILFRFISNRQLLNVCLLCNIGNIRRTSSSSSAL